MSRLVLGIVGFAAVGAGLLYLAGEAAFGVVIVGLVELAAILAIARASTRA